ncbi:MAG: hypothetical protein QOE68_481, partial [Thermoanaerobaculia bacterium]|nr:hypothetical protein [Thermoanaerobaculia bacterium]
MTAERGQRIAPISYTVIRIDAS